MYKYFFIFYIDIEPENVLEIFQEDIYKYLFEEHILNFFTPDRFLEYPVLLTSIDVREMLLDVKKEYKSFIPEKYKNYFTDDIIMSIDEKIDSLHAPLIGMLLSILHNEINNKKILHMFEIFIYYLFFEDDSDLRPVGNEVSLLGDIIKLIELREYSAYVICKNCRNWLNKPMTKDGKQGIRKRIMSKQVIPITYNRRPSTAFRSCLAA